MDLMLSINQPVRTLALSSIGFALRVLATTSPRVEITTPTNDWKRALEGIYLWDSGLDPYKSDRIHEYPISLQFYKILLSFFKIDYAFAATDVLTAILLQRAVYNHLTLVSNEDKSKARVKGLWVLLIHLLSPINILSCASLSTAIFTNFLIAVIYCTLPIKPFRALTCVLCAFLACNNIHLGTLAIPIFLCMEYSSHISQQKKQNISSRTNPNDRPYYSNDGFFSSLSTSTIIFLASVLTLISTSYLLMSNSWTFLKSTYLFVLKIQDPTPNIGMFWYFITDMFDQFVDFFAWIMQINSFIHVVPISIYLRDHPLYALYMVLITSTIFQPYPSLCNAGLILSLLPQWSELLEHMRYGIIASCTLVASLSFCLVFWHLWIVIGTANANFYFGATLAFNVGLLIFMWDLFGAHNALRAKTRLLEETKKND